MTWVLASSNSTFTPTHHAAASAALFFSEEFNMVYRNAVPDSERITCTSALFGLAFPLRLEPTVFAMASRLSSAYGGGYWQFWSLSNGGFYMAPNSSALFPVHCENGFEGQLSADALGIAACLYAYSHLSFGGDALADQCAEHFHWLRDFALDHVEASAVLAAID